MIVYSYTNNKLTPAKGLFNEQWPLYFSEELAMYHYKESGEDTLIFYSTKFKAYMPVRFVKVKLLKFGQVLHAPMREKKLLTKEEELEFLNYFVNFCTENKIFHHLIQSHPSGFTQTYPDHSSHCEFGSYIIDLSRLDNESLLNSFDIKYKKAVIHSIKNGAIVKFGIDHISEFYALHQNSLKKTNIYCDSYSSIHSLVSHLGPDKCEIGVVYDGDEAIGAILIQFTKHIAYVTHAGMGGDSKLHGAMKYLHFEMMKHLRDKNVKYYDFVGVRINSKTESLNGIFKFKKGFGGELKPGYLWKIDLNKSIMKIYNKVNSFRFKNLPHMKDIIDQENLITR